MSPLHSRGSPMPSAKSEIRSGPQQRGTKSKVAPLPSRGPKRGRKCYVTPAFLGVPTAKHGKQNQKWSPTKGNKIRSGCLTAAFLGAQKRAEMLRHRCILRGPQRQARKAKSEVVPNKGEQNQKWRPHPCLLGGPKEGGNAMSPLHSWESPPPSTESKIKSGPQQRGTKSEVAASPLPSRGPKRGWKCYVTPAFSGIQARGAKSEVVPNKGEQNQKWLPHPCLLRGPKRGRKCYVTPAFSGRGKLTLSLGFKTFSMGA